MSGFTHTNLKAIEDSAANRAPNLEAHFARKHLDSEHLGVTYFRYAPGFRAPVGHHHREQEEVYVVVSGSGRMRLDDEIVELNQWDIIRVAPETIRGLEGGPDGHGGDRGRIGPPRGRRRRVRSRLVGGLSPHGSRRRHRRHAYPPGPVCARHA